MSARPWIDAEMLCRSVAALTQNPKGMGFVENQPGVVAGFDLNEARQVRVIPVHAAETLNDD
jgi:hypothetical protein